MDAIEPTSTAAEDGGLRASLRAMWASVASSWGELAEYVDTRGAVVAHAMLDSAGLQRGERVLELACGPGGVGMAAAAIVGPDGAVVLSDIAPEMTAIAAERAKNAGLTNVTTREVDLERIDYPEAAFDKVLCREGLMLVPDPASAVREARRILRPDGRAVFAVWGPRDRNPWLGVLFDAVTAQTGLAVPPSGVPGPFSLEAPGRARRIVGWGRVLWHRRLRDPDADEGFFSRRVVVGGPIAGGAPCAGVGVTSRRGELRPSVPVLTRRWRISPRLTATNCRASASSASGAASAAA